MQAEKGEKPIKTPGASKRFPKALDVAIKIIGAGGCLFFLLYQAMVFGYFRIYLLENQYNAIFMAIVLTLTFILVAAKGARGSKVPWYDVLFIIVSLAGCLYIIINALELSRFAKVTTTPFEMVLGLATVVALIEAVRRSFGWAMVAIVLVFIVYTKFGYLIPGTLNVHYIGWSDLTADIYLSTLGIFGSLTSVASGVIITFIAFGVFFVAAGGGDFFLKLALAATGTMRGGPAKAAIVGSALFGTISGSPSANVVVTGSVTIPMMKSVGYKPYYAGAVETIASTGGIIMPPIMGGVAFVMAMMLGTSYAHIAIISIIPAILYYLAIFFQVHFQAAKMNITGIPREKLPKVKDTLKEGWELIVPFVVLILLLFVFRYPAEVSAIYTIISLIVVSMFRKERRINLKRFIDSLAGGVQSTLAVANIMALAGVILAALTITGLGPRLSASLVTTFGGSTIALVIAAGLACYIMGMGISMIASYILVASLVAPALSRLGVPVEATHMFIMYMVLSTNFTPPYCTASYVAAAIAGAHPFRVGFQAMLLGIACFLVPFTIIWKPELILVGTPSGIVIAVVASIVGIWAISAGIEGYLFSRTNWLQRVMLLIGGLGLFIPGLTTELPGLGLVLVATLWQWWSSRRLVVAT